MLVFNKLFDQKKHINVFSLFHFNKMDAISSNAGEILIIIEEEE